MARQEVEAFFRRREERGKFYCAGCLAAQLTQRGSRVVVLPAWLAALEEAFERPGLLRSDLTAPARPVGSPAPLSGLLVKHLRLLRHDSTGTDSLESAPDGIVVVGDADRARSAIYSGAMQKACHAQRGWHG